MNRLTIFHDPRCALCRGFRSWLERQLRHVDLAFVDYASDEASKIFPRIDQLGADRDIVVMADDGSWWQGPPAWVTCLWTTHEYRVFSHRLAQKNVLPYVRRIVQAISIRRHGINRILSAGRSDFEKEIAKLPEESCGNEGCSLTMPHLAKAKSEPLPRGQTRTHWE